MAYKMPPMKMSDKAREMLSAPGKKKKAKKEGC
jgi:hypothetical protein